jgi:hypothetical protein
MNDFSLWKTHRHTWLYVQNSVIAMAKKCPAGHPCVYTSYNLSETQMMANINFINIAYVCIYIYNIWVWKDSVCSDIHNSLYQWQSVFYNVSQVPIQRSLWKCFNWVHTSYLFFHDAQSQATTRDMRTTMGTQLKSLYMWYTAPHQPPARKTFTTMRFSCLQNNYQHFRYISPTYGIIVENERILHYFDTNHLYLYHYHTQFIN